MPSIVHVGYVVEHQNRTICLEFLQQLLQGIGEGLDYFEDQVHVRCLQVKVLLVTHIYITTIIWSP